MFHDHLVEAETESHTVGGHVTVIGSVIERFEDTLSRSLITKATAVISNTQGYLVAAGFSCNVNVTGRMRELDGVTEDGTDDVAK